MYTNYCTDLDIKSLKLLFSAGDLQHCEIVPGPQGKGWMIHFRRKNGQVLTMQTRRGEDKVYGSINTAAEWARDIGFQRFDVYMPDNPRAKRIKSRSLDLGLT